MNSASRGRPARDPYAADIYSGHPRKQTGTVPELAAERDVVVEDAVSGFCGAVVGIERTYDGEFVRPAATAPSPGPTRSASGSTAVTGLRARTALPSRIWVEGVHDAALVERVWGHDLRVEGVVVEHLEGLDNLVGRLAEFRPGRGRRVGVLVDHLVSGSKESRLTASLGPHVMVTGHPYIDVWQAVRPASVGITAWPSIPRGQDWKTGVCAELGWGSPREGWRRVNAAVSSFRDLETPMIGSVERLVDFVTEPLA